MSNKNNEVFEKGTYAHFHFKNKGKSFLEQRSGKVLSKLQVWLRYDGDLNELDKIVAGKNIELMMINSNGWKDGSLLFCLGENCDMKECCLRYVSKHSIVGSVFPKTPLRVDGTCIYQIEKTPKQSLKDEEEW